MIDLRRNNLDHIRLFLATAVFFYHTAVVSRVEELAWLGRLFSADLAVKGFFVISGFLVFMSYERSRGIGDYLSRRVRRLYPGYVAVVLLAAFGLSLASSLPLRQYFGSGGLWRYLAANLSFFNFLGPSLPGVFDANHLQAVNGSLWTLKIEVMFYLFVPCLAWLLRRSRPFVVLVVLYAFSLAYLHVLRHMAAGPDAFMARVARQLPGQLAYFLAGTGLYLYRHEAGRLLGLKTLLPAVAVLALERFSGIVLLEPLAIALVIVNLAFYRPLDMNVCRFGDLSYGVYIVHFPIVQILSQKGLLAAHPLGGFVIAVVSVYLAAFALWHLVEKRFLRRSSHYLAAAARDSAGAVQVRAHVGGGEA